MHIQPLFAIAHAQDCLHVMQRYPLATLVGGFPQSLQSHLLPMEVVAAGEPYRLRSHVSRKHPLCVEMAEGSEVLAVFQGPNAYISPRWYVNGQRSGRVAPSWNYVAVQARGRLRYIDDSEWMLRHLAALTASRESSQACDQERGWSLADAAGDFVAQMSQSLLGLEIELHEVLGKRFLSQQRTAADRASVVGHLRRQGGVSADVADLIEP